MNKPIKWTMVLAAISVFVITAAFLPALVRAGDLEPGAPPGSTMHTLGEIYDRLETIETKLDPCGPCDPCEEAPVAKTGQTTSYATGDDGDLQNGVTWPDPRFTDHGDGTVTDNLTGLVWTKNAYIYGQRYWTEALSECNSCTEGGYSDWRLPNLRELHSLVDLGRYDPALPAGHPFDNVHQNYWSSTTHAIHTLTYALTVNMKEGYAGHRSKTTERHVWCVRGGQ